MYQLEELSLELSNKCACRCIHCSSGSQPKALPNELSFAKHRSLIREAREDLGATVLSLSGGDPILVDQVDMLVADAKDLGYERILFYTSGVYAVDYHSMDQPGGDFTRGLFGIDATQRTEDIIQAGGDILTFVISLHSHISAVHDYIMNVTGAWHTTTSVIQWLAKHMHVDVEVHQVPMLPNYTHISKMRDLCADMGVSKHSILRFVPQTRGFSNRARLDIGKEEFTRIQEILSYEMDMRAGHPVTLRAGCPIDFRHMIGKADGKPKPCHAGLDLILVRPQGHAHPCAAWKTLPNDDNVVDKSLKEIWENSSVFSMLRTYHEGGYANRGGPCSYCIHEDSCKGGCPAQIMHAYGKSLECIYDNHSDPLCILA